MTDRLERWLPITILVASVMILFYRLFLGEVIFWGTPMLQFYPWREAAFNALRHGELPLWNPMVGNGAPLLANYQTAVFYPPNWLYLVIPTEYAMGLVGVLHVIWAGLGMMVYLQRLGIARLGQGIGALAFALSGYLIGRFGFLSITSAVPWLPWLMWAVDVQFTANGSAKWKNTTLFALITAMLLLAGHAQTAFYSLLLAGCYALWRAFTSPTRWQSLLLSLLAVSFGVAVAAIQLAPTLELMRASQRSGGLEAAFALTYSFWPWRFLTLISPNLFGSPASGDFWGYASYWEDSIYVGLLTLALALRAIVAWCRSRRAALPSELGVVPFFGVTILVSMFLALGQNNSIFMWFYERVPGFDQFQAPTRWSLLSVFALAVLGGIGAQAWQTRLRDQAWARRVIVIGVAVLLGASLAGPLLGSAIKSSLISGTIRVGLLVVLISLAGVWLRRVEMKPTIRAYWQAAVLSLLAIDLTSAHWGLNPTIRASYYHDHAELASMIPANTRLAYTPQAEYDAKFRHFYEFSDIQADDIEHWAIVRASLLPNLGMIDGVPSASNFDPLLISQFDALMTTLDQLDPVAQTQALRQMNVSMMLTLAPTSELELITSIGPIRAYAVPDPWPRAFFAHCITAGDSLQCEPATGQEAVISAETSSSITIDVESDSAGEIVLLDTTYPGWQASVDGHPVPIRLANHAFRAVHVGAGEHVVKFAYKPDSLRIGAVITVIGLVLCAILYWIGSRQGQS